MRVFNNAVCATVAALVMFAVIGFAADKMDKIDKAEVPSAVLSAFAKDYPMATVSEYWKMEENGMTVYKIKATDNMKTMDAVYNMSGSLVKTMEEMPMDMLPTEVQTAVKSKYPDETVKMSEKVMMGNETQYEVELMKMDNATHKVMFDTMGNVVSDKAMEGMKMEKKKW